MNKELLEEVKDFVAEFWGEQRNSLSAETSINVDLGMDGDDAAEFMRAFSDHFCVDLDDFPYDRHFGPEAAATTFSVIEAIILRVETGRWTSLVPLTLGELTDAAERRRWPVETEAKI